MLLSYFSVWYILIFQFATVVMVRLSKKERRIFSKVQVRFLFISSCH